MKLVYVLAAHDVIVSDQTFEVSAVRLLSNGEFQPAEPLPVDKLTMVPLPFTIVTMWKGNPDEFGSELSFEISVVKGEKKIKIPSSTTFGQKPFHSHRLRLQHFPLVDSGEYRIEIRKPEINNQVLGSWSMFFDIVDQTGHETD